MSVRSFVATLDDITATTTLRPGSLTDIPADRRVCIICNEALDEKSAIVAGSNCKCNNWFHEACLTAWFRTKPQCPICKAVCGVQLGSQPDGYMFIHEDMRSLPGHPGATTLVMEFVLPAGTQSAARNHPSPGEPFVGTERIAFLPNTREGRQVLAGIAAAFESRYLFTIGVSLSTGMSEESITFGSVHLKTSVHGGSTEHGYPDSSYLTNVRDELCQLPIVNMTDLLTSNC